MGVRLPALFCSVAIAAGSTIAAESSLKLHLRTGTISPDAVEKSDAIGKYALVQFATIESVNADLLTNAGLTVINYVPDAAFVVRTDGMSAATIRGLDGVAFVGPFRSEYKFAPRMVAKSAQQDGRVALAATGFRGEPVEVIASMALKLDPTARIVSTFDQGGVPHARILVEGTRVSTMVTGLASLEAVSWVDRYYPDRLENTDSVGVIQNNADTITAASIWDQDILGTGQIVAVADSGLDRNEDYFIKYNDGSGVVEAITDAELVAADSIGTLYPNRKVVGYWYPEGASPYDDNEACNDGGSRGAYHGTHVTGTVAGDSATISTPTEPNHDRGDGMAPNAQILFQDIGNDETGCLSGQLGPFDMYTQAVRGGAFILNNSFGAAPPTDAQGNFVPEDNGYFFSDFQADLGLYINEDLLVTDSAGNSGPVPNSIGHASNAKHVVSVGATEHGGDASIAGFSSRGPAHDGRLKPEIVAPGVGIISAFGDDDDSNPLPMFGNGPIALPKQGTSMAAPTVAGGTALLRQYFMDGFYPSGVRNTDDRVIPSGALMKATLLNGTRTYPDTPAMDSGWGRIWLDNNLYFAGDDRQLRVWDLPNLSGLSAGEEHVFNVNVEAGQEFRATLVWRDPPGAGFAGPALVNDLDLEVTRNGETFRGNVFSGARSTTGGSADRINPTEQVLFPSPPAGNYQVRVRASSVPGDGTLNSDRQGYALVVSSAQCDSAVTNAPTLDLAAADQGIAVNIGATAGAQSYQVYRTEGSCADASIRTRFIGTTSDGTLVDDGTQGGFEYAYRVRGADGCGEGPYSVCKSMVSTAACTLEPTFNSETITVSRIGGSTCGVNVSWQAGQTECPGTNLRYNLYRSTDPLFVPGPSSLISSGITGTSFEDLGVDPLTTYYYAVRAEDTTGDGTGPNQGNATGTTSRASITTFADTSSPGDFLDDPDTISVVDRDSVWQISNRRASVGSLSYHNARDGETYPNLTCARIVTPSLSLQQGSPVLRYDASFNLEADWDGVVVEISADGGATWQDLPPAGGYPGDFSMTLIDGEPINQCGYPEDQGAFNGVQSTFETYQSDLSAFAGEDVLIRFSFSSDPGLEFEGFYLDNIEVTSASTPDACEVANVAISPVSGPWFNVNQAGHGWFIEQLDGATEEAPSRINAYWYVYANGAPQWLIATGDLEGSQATLDVLATEGPDFPPNFDTEDLVPIPWGELVFDFDSDTTGSASWNSMVDGFGSGTMPIQQLAPISDSAAACQSGSYFNATQSGHGFAVQVLSVNGEDQLLVSWYVYMDGEQIWLLGQAPLVDGVANVTLSQFSGAQFPPAFAAGDVVSEVWGQLEFRFTGPNSAEAMWEPAVDGFESGSLMLERLTELEGTGGCD